MVFLDSVVVPVMFNRSEHIAIPGVTFTCHSYLDWCYTHLLPAAYYGVLPTVRSELPKLGKVFHSPVQRYRCRVGQGITLTFTMVPAPS
jgi:hypothetical protein